MATPWKYNDRRGRESFVRLLRVPCDGCGGGQAIHGP